MALNGPSCIQSVLEHLTKEDVQMLLANRGLPSVGAKEELTESLQAALRNELCEWEWERCDVPGYHAEIIGAGATLATHGNAILAFGGMDEERSETAHMWRWDLGTDDGFEPVHYRGHVPPKLMSGHFAAVHGDWLWVFPGPRNHNMRRVHCCDLQRFRWEERAVTGDPPADSHARRALDCFPDGRRLIVFGGPQMDRVWFFDFEARSWSSHGCSGGHASWSFGHAQRQGRSLLAYGTPAPAAEEGRLEVWELDLSTYRWRQIPCGGAIPPYRIHSSAAVVMGRWLVHGGRRPGKFNVTNQTYALDLTTWRWSLLMAEGPEPVAREWQRALGLQDCMVLVGGRLDIPDFEPIPITNDTMCSAVEILWSRPRPSAAAPSGKAVMLEQIGRMYASPAHSDVTIIVGGARIAAHRQVLATHSTVFAAMWQQTGLREAETREVAIVDFSEAAVRRLLQYMYGCLPEMPRRPAEVVELFKAADKYDVGGLLRECVAVFRRVTRARHVAHLLQVADERGSGELRGVCVEVACACLPNVVVAPGFKALLQRNTELGLAFLQEVLAKLGIPELPEATDPDGCPLGDEFDECCDAGVTGAGVTAATGAQPQLSSLTGPATPEREPPQAVLAELADVESQPLPAGGPPLAPPPPPLPQRRARERSAFQFAAR